MSARKKFEPKPFEVVFSDDKQRLVKYPPTVDGNVVYELQRLMGKELYHMESRIEVAAACSQGVYFTPQLLHIIAADKAAETV